jgi:hypothetical protein
VTNRYEQLSDRARWFLNKFDEIDLADICASQEAANQTRQEAIDRVLALASDVDDPNWRAPGTEVALRFRSAITGETEPPARLDAGPTVREAAANDRRWPLEKAGES